MCGENNFTIAITYLHVRMVALLVGDMRDSINKRHGAKEIFEFKTAGDGSCVIVELPFRCLLDQGDCLFLGEWIDTTLARLAGLLS